MKNIFKLFILFFLIYLFLLNTGCAERRVISTCFYDCSGIVEKRIPMIISGATGVKEVKRIWSECESNNKCVCYNVLYKGDINDFTSWVHDRLRTSSIRSYRMEPKGDDRLEVHFDLGFDNF